MGRGEVSVSVLVENKGWDTEIEEDRFYAVESIPLEYSNCLTSRARSTPYWIGHPERLLLRINQID